MAAFVKFSRGLKTIYENLKYKDPNTLYLVYDNNESETGSLYLGSKLISSVGNYNNIKFTDLIDISFPDTKLDDGSILYYNSSTGQGQWTVGPLSEIIPNSSQKSNISIVQKLNDIKNANEKDIAVIGSDVYIYHNTKWQQLSDSRLISKVQQLDEKIGEKGDINNNIPPTGLYKEIADLYKNVITRAEFEEQIINLSQLEYKIIENINQISTDNNKNNIIYLVPNADEKDNNFYEEYIVINEKIERIGSFNADLSNYVQNNDDRLLKDSDKEKLDSIGLDENHQAIIQVTQVANLNDVINQAQLIKSVSPGTFKVTDKGELQLKDVPSIDLTDYVKQDIFQRKVGSLEQRLDQIDNNNTSLADEINVIKTSVIWQNFLSRDNN